jgi:predicted CopG family antitoxin
MFAWKCKYNGFFTNYIKNDSCYKCLFQCMRRKKNISSILSRLLKKKQPVWEMENAESNKEMHVLKMASIQITCQEKKTYLQS